MTHQAIDITTYDTQLDEKAQQLKVMLAPFYAEAIDVHASPASHYRMRAEFRVWHDGDDLYYIMFDPETKEKIRMNEFLPGSHLINRLMPHVIKLTKENSLLRHKLFQVDFLTTTSGQAIISLLYHKPLNDDWLTAAQEMHHALQVNGDIQLIGRAKKQKHVIGRESIVETLSIHDSDYHFDQVENSFTQPNAAINQQMIEWVLQYTDKRNDDLLELYCGNGNFSLPLAQRFRHVLATEISKSSILSARRNCELNNITNVTFLRMAAEEFTEVMDGKRESRRAYEANVNQFDCQTVLVDPPRAGLDDGTLALVQRYQRIIYISCNPETLLDNLQTLTQTHMVERAALFDQFPYTTHKEVGVILQRNSD